MKLFHPIKLGNIGNEMDSDVPWIGNYSINKFFLDLLFGEFEF